MPENSKTLHLFTAGFPYGHKKETFLETEIEYLSQHFESIIIYPKTKLDSIRKVPENVSINDFRTGTISSAQKFKILFKYGSTAVSCLFSEIKTKGFPKSFRFFKFLVDYLAIQLWELHSFMQQKWSKNDVFYDYWFSNATLFIALANQKNLIKSAVSRAHGFDVYDEVWSPDWLPFRSKKVEGLDQIFVVSEFGKKYFLDKIDLSQKAKISVSYLGVNKQESTLTPIESNRKVVVSCSRVIAAKGVLETIKLLSSLDTKVHWIHFGDGPQLEELKAQTKNLPENLTVDLKGNIENKQLLNFYRKNKVDLFLSLSYSEGIPVSMMEAISFGVPIAAFPVGGVPEIVKKDLTGLLMERNSTEQQTIEVLLKNPPAKSVILAFYQETFNAELNYKAFNYQLEKFSK